MMHCPICKSSKFQEKSGRKNAKCASCKAMERTRLLYMVLVKLSVLKPSMRILHLEPEPALMKIFMKLSPSGYFPFSTNLRKYNNFECQVYKLSSPADIDKFPYQSFDLIIHNHFLDKVPLSLKYTIRVLSEILKPDGYHIFTTTIDKGVSQEKLREFPHEGRVNQFKEGEQYHQIGRDDFILLLQGLWEEENVYIKNQETFSLQEYLNAALPEKIFNMITPSTIFCHRRSY